MSGFAVASPYLQQVAQHHSKLLTNFIPYTPFSIFAFIHALRVATAYRGAARTGGYEGRISFFQSAIVPAVLILGGSTVTNVLLGIIPGWVITPIPVITYTILPAVLFRSPLSLALLQIPTLPLNILFSAVDGFSRIVGITTFGVDTVISHSDPAVANSPWAMIVIATLAGGGGGLIVPAFKGFHADWAFGTPPWAKEGPGIDVWGATLIGYIYSTLIDAHPFFRYLPSHVLPSSFLPKAYLTSKIAQPLLPAHEAKIACSVILFSLLSLRLILLYITSPSAVAPKKAAITSSVPAVKKAVAPIAGTPKKSGTAKKPHSTTPAEKKAQ